MAELAFVAAVTLAAALVAAVSWGAWRTRVARRRLRMMRAATHHPLRRLVEVVQPLRQVATGQLLLVVDVRTGQEATAWLPAPAAVPGEVALLVWMDGGWVVMDRLRARRVRRAVAGGRR